MSNLTNIPNVKCGIISVSRDCFIISLSENRRKAIYDVLSYLGVGDISYNQPASLPYPTENPFA